MTTGNESEAGNKIEVAFRVPGCKALCGYRRIVTEAGFDALLVEIDDAGGELLGYKTVEVR